MTSRIRELNNEERRDRDEAEELREQLRELGWTIRQLETLSQIPNTGAAMDEIERNRRRNHFVRAFNMAVRRGSRTPTTGVSADATIETMRLAAQVELERQRSRESEIAGAYHTLQQRLRDIALDRDDAERMLADVDRRARREGCDLNYVNQWCP
jgi:sugar phosphate isomerase/epimerase